MTILHLLFLLVIAGICGSIGRAIAGGGRGGCLVSIAVGFIGAALGMYLSRLAGVDEILPLRIGGRSFPVVWSIAGAAIFVAVISFFTRRRRD